MEESILSTIKKLLGASTDYDPFDKDIIVLINSALFTLCQIGVGPKTPFSISDGSETWTDFLGEDASKFEMVKSYIFVKTKIVFDPPVNSFTLSALKEEADMYEWRLNVMSETPTWEETNSE